MAEISKSLPEEGQWVWLYGEYLGEPKGCLAFMGEDGRWYDSEAASNSVTAFGWEPTHWVLFRGFSNEQKA